MSALNENINHTVSDTLKSQSLKNVDIDEDILKYYLQLVILDPEYGKDVGKSKDAARECVKMCIEKLSNENDPSILTVRMQNYFSKNYDTFSNLINKNQDKITKCTDILLKDIVQSQPKTKEENEKLLRRISIYLILKAGLGNPGNLQVLREGTAALHSVFTLQDMKAFTEQKNAEKEYQLDELLSCVSGIRIFNKDCGKGGDSIPDLATSLPEAVEATSLALSHCLIRIMERVNLLTTSIDAYILVYQVNKTVNIDVPEGKQISEEEYTNVCKILSLYRQYEVFVRKLISDMDRIRVENKELILNFSVKLYDLHSLVRFRTAVPADQVFPYFVQLWIHWQKMQNDMYIVSTINNIMWNLDSLHEKMNVPLEIVESLLNGREIVSDAQRIQTQMDTKIDQKLNKCQVLYPKGDDFDEIVLQYLGFCSLCLCIGALIPANPKLGICLWNNKHFAFCCVEHAKTFGLNPDRYIKEVLQYMRGNVELINFLQIYEDLYAIRSLTTLTTKTFASVKTVEKEMQTELHPIPSYIDKNYSWNIWEHKKKAVQLANIMNCKTHSSQTKYSYGRFEFGCQTNNGRDKTVQTMTDVGTSTPALKNYIWGLRGQKEDVQHVIDLTTRPVNRKKC